MSTKYSLCLWESFNTFGCPELSIMKMICNRFVAVYIVTRNYQPSRNILWRQWQNFQAMIGLEWIGIRNIIDQNVLLPFSWKVPITAPEFAMFCLKKRKLFYAQRNISVYKFTSNMLGFSWYFKIIDCFTYCQCLK